MNFLFHGPGAKSTALADAQTRGKLSGPLIGEGGLKVDDSRDLIDKIATPLPGKEKKAFVVGPMDLANVNSADALLKTLEDLDHGKFVLNLWASDAMNVQPTIVSRCLTRWCPDADPSDVVDDEESYPRAMELLEAYRRKDCLAVIEIAKDKDKSKLEVAFRLIPEVLSPALLAGGSERDFTLWENLRIVLRFSNLSRTEMVAVLLP